MPHGQQMFQHLTLKELEEAIQKITAPRFTS